MERVLLGKVFISKLRLFFMKRVEPRWIKDYVATNRPTHFGALGRFLREQKKKIGRKVLFPLRELRARIDSERLNGNPTPKRELVLKKRDSLIGWILNRKVVRPNKGKSFRQDIEDEVTSYTRKDIINARKGK
jgi:hypothetical protein